MKKSSRNPNQNEKQREASLEQGSFTLSPASLPQERESLFFRILLQVLILGLGMYGCLYSFLTAFGISYAASALPVWLGLYVLVAVVVYSFSAWPLLVLIPGLPLAAWGFFSLDSLSTGFVSLLNQVLQVMTENSPWVFVQYELPSFVWLRDLPGLEQNFLLLASCLMTLVAGYFVVRRPNLPVFLVCTAPFLILPLFFTLAPDLRAFFALAASWLLLGMVQTGFWRKRAVKQGRFLFQKNVRRQLALVLLACSLLSVGTASVLLPQEGYRRPQSAEEFLQQLQSSGIGGWFQSAPQEEVGLHSLSSLHFTGETALEIQCSTLTPMYLRGYAAGVFQNDAWEVTSDSNYESASADFTWYDGNRLNPMNLYARMQGEGAQLYDVTVRNVNPARNSVFVPGGVSTDLASMADGLARQDLYVEKAGGSDTYPLSAALLPDLPGSMLTASASEVPREFQIPEEGNEGIPGLVNRYENYLYEPYTALPDDIRAAAENWLAERGFTPISMLESMETLDVGEVCRQLQSIFQSEFRYSYTPPVFPNGENFLEWFLQDAQEGYCVHYATAGTLLLRALGIPARYAEGYIVTQDDYAGGQWSEDGYLQIPDSNAHAWTEVYDPDTGAWIPVEMTPGFSSQQFWDSPSGTAASPSPSPTPEPSETPAPTETPAPSENPDATPTPTPAGGADGPDSIQGQGIPQWIWPALSLLATVLLAAALVVGRRKWLMGRRQKAWGQPDAREAVRAYWKWAFRMLRCAGLPLPDGEQTSGEYLQALCEKCSGLDLEKLQKAYEIGEKARFARQAPAESDRAFLAAWRLELEEALLAKMSPPVRLYCRWVLCLV